MYEPGIVVRKVEERDVDQLAELIFRFYLFNEEFDPAWSMVENARERAREIAELYANGQGYTLIAQFEDRIIGFIHAEIIEKPMLASGRIGVIKELYVIPQFRGQGIATRLVDELQDMLKDNNIYYIAAEFPSANVVAEGFYRSRKFRPYTSLYLREV
ncbi:MAG: GNAT family N-acetyltransferase [Desulfurococcales archaeon]|nr:GNAT family N-acetyltransferase [Desulfurococcales archaeon]MEB3789526.1 GNAT family N-acetyltransferase [Desulfurococcales archaeon]